METVKSKEQLLKDFKRANKDRRVKLALKAGFNTIDDYRDYLMYFATPLNEKVNPKEETQNIFKDWGSTVRTYLKLSFNIIN